MNHSQCDGSKWSWDVRGKVKYSELVELMDKHNIKVYGSE